MDKKQGREKELLDIPNIWVCPATLSLPRIDEMPLKNKIIRFFCAVLKKKKKKRSTCDKNDQLFLHPCENTIFFPQMSFILVKI